MRIHFLPPANALSMDSGGWLVLCVTPLAPRVSSYVSEKCAFDLLRALLRSALSLKHVELALFACDARAP